MTHAAVQIIRAEHDALRAVLRSIGPLLEQWRRAGKPPDFTVLRAMLFYIDEFPEQRHHRKESALLFPKLRARTPIDRDLLDHLDADHARGEGRIRDLQHALLAYEMMGESRRVTFEQGAKRYADFYLSHMRMEEERVLPLASRVLDEEDWRELDEAFLGNRDPLAGNVPESQYEELFRRIVRIVPAPLGLGTPA